MAVSEQSCESAFTLNEDASGWRVIVGCSQEDPHSCDVSCLASCSDAQKTP